MRRYAIVRASGERLENFVLKRRGLGRDPEKYLEYVRA